MWRAHKVARSRARIVLEQWVASEAEWCAPRALSSLGARTSGGERIKVLGGGCDDPGCATAPERAICARMTESFESLPLPDHPLLRAWASAMNDAGYWADVLDAKWRWVFSTDDTLLSYKDMEAPNTPPIGSHFFSAEARADTTGSESAAAKACLSAARTLRETLPDIAVRSELSASELSLRFGLHWGATLYMGRILTGGRSEVTALGDEMNEVARIEACATGGRTLASKPLIERLNREDANALGLDTGHIKYTPLADLSTATDKARRDAPSIAVCEV
jgi:class 3 adenylate cyclase